MTKLRKSILVVDDDPQVAAYLQRLLRGAGFEALTALDKTTAVVMARELRPDLLLVDLVLGHANGWEVAKAAAGSAPFVMMTGAQIEDSDLKDAELLGAAAIVQKPFDSAALVALLRRVLGDGR